MLRSGVVMRQAMMPFTMVMVVMMVVMIMVVVTVLFIAMMVMMVMFTLAKRFIRNLGFGSRHKRIPCIRERLTFGNIQLQPRGTATFQSAPTQMAAQYGFTFLGHKRIDRGAFPRLAHRPAFQRANTAGHTIHHCKKRSVSKMIRYRRQPSIPPGYRNCNLHTDNQMGICSFCQSLLA